MAVATGRGVSWGKVVVVTTTVLVWTLGIVVFDSDYAFTVTNVLVHGVPYFGLVWLTERRAAERRQAVRAPRVLSDRAAASLLVFLVPLVAAAFLEEWGWDRLVWHDNGAIFPGPAVDPGAVALALLVPLLALPQATHYLLDAWIWKVRPENASAAEAVGIAAGAGAEAVNAHGPLGHHLLLDVAGAPFAVLDDAAFLEEALLAAVKAMGATVLGVHLHRLSPQGVSGVVVISESHLTVHTWPERGEAAVDLFTCGDPERARAALVELEGRLQGTRAVSRELERGADAC